MARPAEPFRAGEPVIRKARAPTAAEARGVLEKITTRLMKMLTRHGYLIEEQGMTYLAERAAHNALRPLQAASGHRAALAAALVIIEMI